MIYAKILAILTCCYQSIMYTVKLNEQTITKTDDQILAWANYRSLLRRGDISDNTAMATILHDDNILQSVAISTASADSNVGIKITPNQILSNFMQTWQLSLDDLLVATKLAGLNTSKSKLKGWLMPVDNRKYQVLHNDELYLLLPHLINVSQVNIGYTPANLRKLTQLTGLSAADFIRTFDLKSSSYFASLAEADTSTHRAMSYKTWSALQKKVANFLKSK